MIEEDVSKITDLVCLVIPTCRIQEAQKTVDRYAEHFQKYGHHIAILVFDSTPGETSKADIEALANSHYKGDIYYIGSRQKQIFVSSLAKKTGADTKILQPIFASNYGGTRNCTLIYTLGRKMVTVDDDVYPFGYFVSKEELKGNEVAKGTFIEPNQEKHKIEKDIIGAFLEVLGKKVSELNWSKGKYIEDSAMDLLSNNSKNGLGDNILYLIPGKVKEDQKIMQAQTFRTGSPDIDARDYINEFFAHPDLIVVNDLSKTYALSNFKPCVTDLNWRVDSGVTGLDNREGLPPFIPTRLRFEDYIFRLWLQDDKVASAHIDAVQNHQRSQKNRAPLADDYLNEEMASLMKKHLRKMIKNFGPLKIDFYQDFKIDDKDLYKIMSAAKILYNKTNERIKKSLPNGKHFRDFADRLSKNFVDFNQKIFNEKIKKDLTKEFKTLNQTMAIWPKIIEAANKISRPAIKLN